MNWDYGQGNSLISNVMPLARSRVDAIEWPLEQLWSCAIRGRDEVWQICRWGVDFFYYTRGWRNTERNWGWSNIGINRDHGWWSSDLISVVSLAKPRMGEILSDHWKDFDAAMSGGIVHDQTVDTCEVIIFGNISRTIRSKYKCK